MTQPDYANDAAGATGNPVIVGVIPDQPVEVVLTAARFAQRFAAPLICVQVNPTRYLTQVGPDGSVMSLPLDPDLGDEALEVFDPDLEQRITEALAPRGVEWSVRALAGGPAFELGRLAEEVDAAMIVVGTRLPGFRGSVRSFLTGSVVAQLSHRQHRPVVVVPLSPVGSDDELPWNTGHERGGDE